MEYERTDVVVDRLELLRAYGYGLCMGTADALPGVSGGTVALLLGFYGRLIAAVTAFTPRRAVTILRGTVPSGASGRARRCSNWISDSCFRWASAWPPRWC